jgi:hypothetical protein
MARTKEEIYNSMLAAKTADTTLNAVLTSLSNTAIYRLMLWVIAETHYYFETLFDAFKVEVEDLALAAQVGNARWYRTIVLNFQYGDNLVLIGDKYQYATIDATKKIVARCAIEEMPNSAIRIKVAKLDGNNLVALTNSEQNALISYVKKVRFAGTRFQIFSNNGDQLKIGFDIYFDPIITQSTVKTNVENTIKNYVSNLPFNGELVVTKLIDEIQKIDGVNDVIFTEGAYRFSSSDPYTPITRNAIATGGFFTISATTGETLNDTINYIAQ